MNRRRLLLAVLGAVLAPPAAPAAGEASTVVYGGRITRATVLARAHDWLRRGVPYSQHNARTRWDLNRGRRYRPDCSGFVCMAWAVDSRDPRYGRALTTWELPRVADPIAWSALRPGDILLRTKKNRRRDHVRLFEAWGDPAHGTVTVIESSGKAGGMRRNRVVVARAARHYRPYRYRKIV
ncbi:hypothetical protein J2S43_003907 [Catenuloplanes nepalensis]|uniref:NlpC/P60 domain-containing protein n=1 Tax=Catenuloplanes nepalensis TaxID=587533 RepID=A0ABT9MVC6_9ACTN|nr:hypothetical protein [Catenuloplanes nepalensis]MDP9795395.1 hypothetical protein [Catenuloplanes nepalensis]